MELRGFIVGVLKVRDSKTLNKPYSLLWEMAAFTQYDEVVLQVTLILSYIQND